MFGRKIFATIQKLKSGFIVYNTLLQKRGSRVLKTLCKTNISRYNYKKYKSATQQKLPC